MNVCAYSPKDISVLTFVVANYFAVRVSVAERVRTSFADIVATGYDQFQVKMSRVCLSD